MTWWESCPMTVSVHGADEPCISSDLACTACVS